MSAGAVLTDTNVLLRLVKLDDPEYPSARSAVRKLRQDKVKLCYTLQNMAELWNVSTRPRERNGFGLTVEQTEWNVRKIERGFTYLPDNEVVYRNWRRLLAKEKVLGVQVHDARLAAAMYAHGMNRILTFNISDFTRFEGIQPIHPSQFSSNTFSSNTVQP